MTVLQVLSNKQDELESGQRRKAAQGVQRSSLRKRTFFFCAVRTRIHHVRNVSPASRDCGAAGASGGAGQKGRWGQSTEGRLQTPSGLEGSRLLTEPLATKRLSFTQPERMRTGRGGRCADSALAVPVEGPATGFLEVSARVLRPAASAPRDCTGPRTMSPKLGRLHVPDSGACERWQ